MSAFPKNLKRIAFLLALVNACCFLFLDLREWLVYFDPWIVMAAIVPGYVIGLPALPFLYGGVSPDKSSSRAWLGWLFISALMVLMELLWLLMIFIAAYCRDVNWNFHWPWDPGSVNLTLLNRVNLSEWIWPRVLGAPMPSNPMLRESFGIMAVLFHLLAVPAIAAKLLPRPATALQFWRMFAIAAIVQLLIAFPLKMLLTICFNLKYVVAFPEQFFNI